MMDMELSGTTSRKIYLVTDYNLQSGEIKTYDSFDIIFGNIEEVKKDDPEGAFATLANGILNSIYHDLKGRIDKIICIGVHHDNMKNFMYSNNILDAMTEILDNYCDPSTLIINIVPYELNYWTQYYDSLGIDDEIYMTDKQIAQVVNKFEYLGFRATPSNNDNNVLIYMNSAGINVYNNKLRIMEYDYGK